MTGSMWFNQWRVAYPNAPNNYGDTPIHKAACNRYTEIVKILAPLTDSWFSLGI